MKFPGSKLLYQFDMSVRSVPLDELLRSCEQVGLTGFAEVSTRDGVGMIFYYLGTESNVLHREGHLTQHGAEALQALRLKLVAGEGEFAVYELPLDMAHLLRGITNRRKVGDPIESVTEFGAFLERLEMARHTGTLEVQTSQGAAMLLLVQGRVSNSYWETPAGLTFEKGDARTRLEQALPKGPVHAFLSDFSQTVWKGRHETDVSIRSRLDTSGGPSVANLLAQETALRKEVLDRLVAQVPAQMQVFLFDLMTGAVLARRGRGTDALRVSPLADKVPPLTMYLRDLVAATQDDDVELIEFQTGRTSILIAVVPNAQEALAVLADKSQPTALIGAVLQRAVRAYAAGLQPVGRG